MTARTWTINCRFTIHLPSTPLALNVCITPQDTGILVEGSRSCSTFQVQLRIGPDESIHGRGTRDARQTSAHGQHLGFRNLQVPETLAAKQFEFESQRGTQNIATACRIARSADTLTRRAVWGRPVGPGGS